MNYKITIVNKTSNTEKLFEGSDVNEVLQNASQYYYDLKPNITINRRSLKKTINDTKKHFANTATNYAIQQNDNKKNILIRLDDGKLDLWSILINRIPKTFDEMQPSFENEPEKPILHTIPNPPTENDHQYFVSKKWPDAIFKKRYKIRLDLMKNAYLSDHNSWLKKKENILAQNRSLEATYNELILKTREMNNARLDEWNNKKSNFDKNYADELSKIEIFRLSYNNKDIKSIEKYYELILKEKLELLDYWEKEAFITYNEINRTLYIEYLLPSTSDIEAIKEIKYNQTKDLFVEVKFKKAEYDNYYDVLLYQISLFVLYIISINDYNNSIEAIAFNGFVKSIDKASGANIEPCILSLFVQKEEILKLNLKQVDSRVCFKNLKGVSSSILASHTAIPPIISFDKNDKRFVQSKEIISTIDEGLNIAAMDWEDFEHLVREIFEKEFSINGGEVKVTQASRDGGVDAIAYDPDPIRGGKIIIQAKRYTNTVGVNAVRDLYGTILNEGATKGILVTTSDYGPDAYEFSKGKPITLLNGSNLLHLLEKHGHHAKIDLQEAKNIFSSNITR